MIMNTKAIIIGLFIYLITVQVVNGADWVFYASDSYGNNLYYDRESIINVSKDVKRVWEKTVYSDEGRSLLISSFKKNFEESFEERAFLARKGLQNLSHTITLWEINCGTREMCLLSSTYYDQNGHVLIDSLSDGKLCVFIVPGTLGEVLFKAVCSMKSRGK
jgi:hypothetical protein